MTPKALSSSQLPKETLQADKKACRRFGPCGVGERALYLNSFWFERFYYVPIAAVRRVFKRVAMSQGGFTGKAPSAPFPISWWSMTTGSRSSAPSSGRRMWTCCWRTSPPSTRRSRG